MTWKKCWKRSNWRNARKTRTSARLRRCARASGNCTAAAARREAEGNQEGRGKSAEADKKFRFDLLIFPARFVREDAQRSPTHADDGAVPPDQKRTASGCA